MNEFNIKDELKNFETALEKMALHDRSLYSDNVKKSRQRVIDEFAQLQEAVKLLGVELKEKIQEVQDYERHMSGNVYSLSIPNTLLNNPIAVAAVKGTN